MPFYFSDIQTDINSATIGARDPKESVRVATTANITLSGTQTIDGVAVIAGNRVLVKNQSSASANGIYDCAGGAWTRSLDSDESAKMTCGCRTYIEEGTVNAKTHWVLTTVNPITLGSTSLVFERDTEAGTGLTRTANSLAVAYGATGSTACVGNDSRLSDTRTPTSHAASHKSAGGDAVKLDELAAPTDITTLNVSTGAHGLTPKLPNDGTQFLNGAGNWSVPTGSGISQSEATATGTITTTSASDVQMTSMTSTPGAGTYLVLFSTSIAHSNAAGAIYVSIYGNGVQVAASERRRTATDLKQIDMVVPLATQAVVSVAAAQVIEVKWRTSTSTATAYQRTMTLIKIG